MFELCNGDAAEELPEFDLWQLTVELVVWNFKDIGLFAHAKGEHDILFTHSTRCIIHDEIDAVSLVHESMVFIHIFAVYFFELVDVCFVDIAHCHRPEMFVAELLPRLGSEVGEDVVQEHLGGLCEGLCLAVLLILYDGEAY